jgi:nitrite reductase (NADH) small subunit
MTEIYVGKRSEFSARDRKVVVVQGVEIGVFRLEDSFFAYENTCPHMGGPVCQGKLINRVEEVLASDKTAMGLRFSPDVINIVCPWHGFEYDIRTGAHQGNASLKLKPYKVKLAGDDVFLVM